MAECSSVLYCSFSAKKIISFFFSNFILNPLIGKRARITTLKLNPEQVFIILKLSHKHVITLDITARQTWVNTH